MLRSCLTLLFVSFVSVSVDAQTRSRSMLRPVTSPVKYAGTYHLGLGTWTRGLESASAPAPDVIYNNTCPMFYFEPMSQNEIWTDEGRIPSPTGPVQPPAHNSGCSTSYLVDGFQIGYCTILPSLDVIISFQDSYAICAAPAPQHSFALTGLPGSSSGHEACWAVNIDLAASSMSFNMLADGTGSFPTTDNPLQHLFGWSFSVTSPVHGYTTGPLLAGNPIGPHTPPPCSGVDGTRWDTLPGAPPPTWPANLTSNLAAPFGIEWGKGMDTQNVFRIDGASLYAPGCYYFQSNPVVSFHLMLFADAQCPLPTIGVPFCFGDGSLPTPCPCSNSGSIGQGCDNSAGTGGSLLSATGVLQPDTLVLRAVNELPSALSVFLQGKLALSSGIAFGDGVRCIAQDLLRIGTKSALGGVVAYPQSGDLGIRAKSAALGDPIPAGATRYYQTYYRDPAPTFCPPPQGDTWNISNGVAIVWP